MQEEQNKPEEKKELSPEEQRKLALEAEMTARKVLFSTKNTPYKKEYGWVEENGGKVFKVTNPITPNKPFHNSGKQTRAMRRGREKVEFSLFQNHVETHYFRKNTQGRWIGN